MIIKIMWWYINKVRNMGYQPATIRFWRPGLERQACLLWLRKHQSKYRCLHCTILSQQSCNVFGQVTLLSVTEWSRFKGSQMTRNFELFSRVLKKESHWLMMISDACLTSYDLYDPLISYILSDISRNISILWVRPERSLSKSGRFFLVNPKGPLWCSVSIGS